MWREHLQTNLDKLTSLELVHAELYPEFVRLAAAAQNRAV